MSNWCPRCNEFMFYPDSHRCAPVFVCEPAESQRYGTGYEVEIHALEAERAAEKFCEQWDAGGDYDIIQAGSFEVKVTDPRTGDVTHWEIVAESVPQYSAYPRAAQGTEAGTAETEGLGPKDDGPVGNADAPNPLSNPNNQMAGGRVK